MKQHKNKGIAPPRYDDAFKAGAILLVTESGQTPKEVAAELGICIDTLRSWLKRSGYGGVGGGKPVDPWQNTQSGIL